MSYESFERIVECSHKMIAKEVQAHFVPRKSFAFISHSADDLSKIAVLKSICYIVYIIFCVYVEIAKKLISRLEYNHEIETLKFKYLVAQETIEKLQKELKLKEDLLHLKQRNSGRIFNSCL